ncbi:OmpP1/FadL family transporter [Thiohalophilus sp.]|uniref:OmpP1/FadL family transporter n=1 Tax=Thiohalophilus sp. TaxID=3028392 RepID=UPI002ACE00C3|nr:outer membrane protein transport protein [Thiohalophilus sp.]MDZ7802965.1 outer membrane protein transport protein [Thiohalophilus sp.]
MSNTRYALLILVLSFPVLAHATNGYFSHGAGTKSKAMAGAGSAIPEDALNAAINPANLVLVGPRVDAGASLFLPVRGFRANDDATAGTPQIPPGQYDSEQSWFLIPQFAWAHKLSEDSATGVVISANGLSTRYDAPLFRFFEQPGAPDEQRASAPVGADLYQLFVHVPYSIRLGPNFTAGIGPIMAVQAFRARGMEPFRAVSIAPDAVTNNGFDYSYGIGLSLGLNYRPTEWVALAFGLQPRIDMTPFDKYQGAFAEQGDFDIPLAFQFGVSFEPHDDLTLSIDYQEIRYSEIAAIGNTNNRPLTTVELGSDEGIGGGWDDAQVLKLGARWHYAHDLVLRAGYSRMNQIIPRTQAMINIVAPAVSREHFSIGFTKQLDPGHEWSAALTWSPEESVRGLNPNTGDQTGDLQMQQTELEIIYSWRF